MKQEDKLGLFHEGVIAGYNFLENFNWPEYKRLRAAEFDMHRAFIPSSSATPDA